MIDNNVLAALAELPFDGNTSNRKQRGSGPRRAFLYKKLRDAGQHPFEDEYGNLWVEKGTKGEPILLSSHMDVDMTQNKEGKVDFVVENSSLGKTYRGILDNAVGCYLNLALANQPREQRALYVFTASEEENPDDENDWARSAKDVVNVLEKKGIRPELCVAVDVSYPRLLVTAQQLDDAGFWDSHEAHELFDQHDKTECYIDGMSSPVAEAKAWAFVRRYLAKHSGNVKLRNPNIEGFDESAVYKMIAPAFCFGPVGFGGKYDLPDQHMPKKNVETALEFLTYIIESR